MAGILNDLRHAARLYARTPLASLLAVVVLAIGIAFVGAFVSLYVDLALRPHPGFAQGGRLITIGPDDRGRFTGRPSGIVEAVAAEASSVEAVAASIALSAMAGPEREMHPIELVTAQFFDGLQAKLALGRGFSAEEHLPGAERVVVISHRFWQSELAGAYSADVGRRFRVKAAMDSGACRPGRRES